MVQWNGRTALVTGGSGFLGGLLLERLLELGWRCINIDLVPCPLTHPTLRTVQGDLREPGIIARAAEAERIDVIFHCAAMLAHDAHDERELWSANVEATKAVAEAAQELRVGSVVYTSTNCLWGQPLGRPVREEDEPCPVETYGQAKWEGEKILWQLREHCGVVILRCPTIIDAGRLGLLAILFEFIADHRRVWTVGAGANRYQFIYAQDLIEAMLLAANHDQPAVFGVGSDRVDSLRDTYRYVIEHAGSRSRVCSLPRGPALLAMRLLHRLKLSPLGPYHYRMIAESFEFDTTRIQQELGWRPTVTNAEMLLKAYSYYKVNRDEIAHRRNASSHRSAASMGAIRLLKWMS